MKKLPFLNTVLDAEGMRIESVYPTGDGQLLFVLSDTKVADHLLALTIAGTTDDWDIIVEDDFNLFILRDIGFISQKEFRQRLDAYYQSLADREENRKRQEYEYLKEYFRDA